MMRILSKSVKKTASQQCKKRSRWTWQWTWCNYACSTK